MISRRGLLRVCSLPLFCVSLLSACGSAPREEDVALLIRDGDFDAARVAAETLIARGTIDAQIPLLAGALALQAGDFSRARELFAAESEQSGDAPQPWFATGLERDHWQRLTALRAGTGMAPEIADTLAFDPLGAVIAGKISAQEFVNAKIDGARRLADATVLSIQQSAGRDGLLNRLSREQEAHYRCTGNFVAGERSLAAGDRASARQFLQAALASGAENLLEFHVSKAELTHLA
jgi:hypothetical protein